MINAVLIQSWKCSQHERKMTKYTTMDNIVVYFPILCVKNKHNNTIFNVDTACFKGFVIWTFWIEQRKL